jgi:hypothetical protein
MTKKSDLYMDLLWDTGRRCFDDLRQDEARILTGYLIREAPSACRNEYIIENSNFDDFVLDIADLLIADNSNEFATFCSDYFDTICITNLINATTAYARNTIDLCFEVYQQGECHGKSSD